MPASRSRFLVAALAVACSFAPALAQNLDAISARQQLMKDNGRAAKTAAQMIKGDVAYDPAKADEVFATLHETAVKFGDYFPEDSKTGGKTEAAPAIWDKPDAFKAALAKFQSDTEAAMAKKPQDVDAFKQAFGMVAQNCKGCHQDFRVER
ncbi:c-type cytochrome [Mangrovibrevibacter kandeliae]|uniref:c-type cytochrome n=1 Tax=Mangrovibrevibacter kandeliae TaxID=2968473 RepID=UPI0021195443|nr:cytochrome c [Aurantimonas sp. CSK15Z-1]MCQ8780861.1 cytochrome c [Aurantimonas sp. CSK15Z-1]